MAVMKSILIIEDEKDIVDLVEYHLKQSGFSVISALDGPAGLEKAKRKAESHYFGPHASGNGWERYLQGT